MTKASKGLPLTVSLHIPTSWTSEQAFAVFELVDDLREAIWRCYALQLQDQYRAINSSRRSPITPTTTMASRRSDARCHAKKRGGRNTPFFFHPWASAIYARIIAAGNSPSGRDYRRLRKPY